MSMSIAQLPEWARSALDEVARRYPHAQAEISQSMRSVCQEWPALQTRVFEAVSQGYRQERTNLRLSGGSFPPWEMACNIVFKCALVWVIRHRRSTEHLPDPADRNPLQRARAAKSQLFAAERQMLSAGRAFVRAVDDYRRALTVADQAAVPGEAVFVDLALGTALREVAETHGEWAEHTGLEEGPLMRVLAVTDEMSGDVPTVADLAQAMLDRCGQWQLPTYRGSSPTAEETLLRPFLEAMDRSFAGAAGACCTGSGPLAWLNDEQVALLLQVVRGGSHLPLREAVRNARKAFHAGLASLPPDESGEVRGDSA